MQKEAILEMLEESVPHEELMVWLRLPNLDLDSLTPDEVLDQGKYDQVIDALWLKDSQFGPVS
jgi:hypothetical protein